MEIKQSMAQKEITKEARKYPVTNEKNKNIIYQNIWDSV